MYDDGSFEGWLKFGLGGLFALAAAKMFWHWLTQDVWHWLTVDVWGWITEHPWWSALIAAPVTLFVLVFLVGLFLPDEADRVYGGAEAEQEEPLGLTYSLDQLAAMSPAGFEQACADLLARDGFLRARRVGGAGDLGADVVAWDAPGNKIVLQCKQYARPVGSTEIQTFNGTARPEHGADTAVIVGLNGFTTPASHFAARHDITLIGREDLESWAQGEHLYLVIAEERSAA
ncbi:restriction endonuclease [Streptomyces platensis]|uniref:restriction endonuclease n=1 Tax=Streptomyces platensis TaxID=58346 RepID=UPI0036C932FD